ncbi:MAG: sugar phosphate isomerase/epimerase [Synergistaceae bacterium]|jgi:sugar phosphate isomerase/epimerase|nr:sugar phosphate isomerase/epimerase [Synergistaceae bacterium]
MNLYISTTLRDDREAGSVFSLLDDCEDGSLGIEIFPLCHEEGYFRNLDRLMPRLAEFPVTFHEPYYESDHSFDKTSQEYFKTRTHCERTFEYAASLRARHVVYHLNNRPVEDRETMIQNALFNLWEMGDLAKSHGLEILVENTGIISLGNMLFDQREFTRLIENLEYDCLFDIGHANCNAWHIESALMTLRNKIRCYHVHNNYGVSDDHNRIQDGTLDTERFWECYREYTPDADIVIEYRPELLQGDNLDWLKDDIAYIRKMTSNIPLTEDAVA